MGQGDPPKTAVIIAQTLGVVSAAVPLCFPDRSNSNVATTAANVSLEDMALRRGKEMLVV